MTIDVTHSPWFWSKENVRYGIHFLESQVEFEVEGVNFWRRHFQFTFNGDQYDFYVADGVIDYDNTWYPTK